MKHCFKNLQDFILAIENKGELKRVLTPVSPYLEITKYTDHESKSPNGGKALLFEKVKGFDFPVITNAFGSQTRICLALGVDNLCQLGERLQKIINMRPNLFSSLFDVLRCFPRKARLTSPPCQEVVYTGKDVDLLKIPVLHCWPKDGGSFITLPVVITRSLITGKRNAGMYRMQVFDKNTTGMHWHIHKDGSHYYQEYCKAGKRMPVAVAIGTDPATTYASTAPLPRGADEFMLAGFLRRKPVALTKCLTIDLEVPAEAEFVLEGYVDPGETRLEGPFGDHTGYYSLVDYYPVFHVTAITHRKQPIYSATIVGRPPMEDCYLAKATERLFLPLIKTVFPEIKDYWLPWEGVFHNIVVVAMQKEYPGHAQKIMSGLWGQGQISFSKAIVVVDEIVNPQDPKAVMQELLNKLDITSDITIAKGVLDVLDHSAPQPLYGSKIGVDLTSRLAGEPERVRFAAPQDVKPCSMPDTPVSGVVSLHPLSITGSIHNKILLIKADKGKVLSGASIAGEIIADSRFDYYNIILLLDIDVDLSDYSLVLWKLFNNVDPVRDMYFAKERLVVDACRKGVRDGHAREWPEDIAL
ncbi:MAG: menaquinone biosynthesis decarboxylase [Pseudomonadota bacterium]